MSGQRSSFRKFVHVLVSLTLISNSFFLALQFPLFAPSQTVYAQPGVATVTVQPQSGTIQVSDTFTVTVSIANPTTPLTAFQFDLTYDQNLLGLVDLLPGAFLSSTGRGVTCPQQAYPTWGVIRFACASSGLENAPVGTGLLAEFTFVALYPGTSPLIVSAINLAGPNVPPTPIPATPQSHTVTVTPTPGVVFGNNQTMISSPGMQVTHVFTLTNLGNYTDTFTLGVAGYTWSTTLPATTIGPLSIGETAPVEVQVDIPNSFGGTIIATDSFTITATSSHDPNISAVAQGTTLAEVNPGVTLGEDQAGSGVIQTNIHYALSVTNTGDYTDTFHLTVTSDWPTTLTHQETQPLSAGESFPYTLTVTIPQVAIGSQDTATITAISGWNTAIEDELGVTTTAIESERNTYLPIMVRSGGTTAMPATTPDSAPGLLPTGIELPRGVAYGIPQTPSQTTLLPNCYSADLDCDLDVDEADLALEAQHWNCSVADPCYSPVYDLDGNNVIDVFDLAWVGNDYDTTSPIITISTPEIGAIVGGTQVNVTGVVSDVHDIMTVTVNGMHATLVGTDYSITIPIVSGNHVLNVIATDVVGQVAAISQIIGVDADGPMINVHKPKNRQSVYSLTPTVAISYTDFYTSVNVTTFGAWLVNDAGIQTDITNDLTVTPNSAHGFISTPLIENMAYTLTISLADTLGNITQKEITFFVPNNAGTITPPTEPDNAGWISGVVYDSATCDEFLTQCLGLTGASVTLTKVDPSSLAQVKQTYAQQLNVLGPIQPTLLIDAAAFSAPITGTIITGPDGFFAFPVVETGVYWLRVEKEGYTYGQREAEIVREHSSATNPIYLTPMDAAVTICAASGCFHTSADGQMTVDIPAGAIPVGDEVEVTATEFDRVVFLPSGELPPGTWETYAFNLGGDSDYQFQEPITISLQNSLGFAPGSEIPLGYWNQSLMQWEHEGFAIVDSTGQWVVMQVMHFSNHDPNYPISIGTVNAVATDNTDKEDDDCDKATQTKCIINLSTGTLGEEIILPPVMVLGEQVAPHLQYDTESANPNYVIDVQLDIDPDSGVIMGDYVVFTLFIEGQATQSITFEANLIQGEVGRYRYFWDGRNAQGDRLPSGVYEYRVRLAIPYTAEYCGTTYFGGPPDCANRPTGIFTEGAVETWVSGTIEVETRVDSSFGAGWSLDGMQQLYEGEAGDILISNWQRQDEFYFPQRNLLHNRNQFSPNNLAIPLNPTPGEFTTYALPSNSRPPFVQSYGELDRVESVPESISANLPQPPEFTESLTYQETHSVNSIMVCGEIITDTIWTTSPGVYTVTCDVSVQTGVLLTIEPGVVVQFEHTMDDLIVFGTLQAVGTEAEPIKFQPVTPALPGSWGRVAFLAGSAGVLDHVILEYGGVNDGLLYLASDNVQVVNAVVRYSTDTGIVIANASPTISGTQIISNTGVLGGGIFNDSGHPIIRNNTFQGNHALDRDYSYTSYGGAVYNINGNMILQGNIFSNNFSDYSGGAIYAGYSNAMIQGNLFLNNSARCGGAIFNEFSGAAIQDNTFQGNSAVLYGCAYDGGGGGIFNLVGNPTIRNNNFQDNVALNPNQSYGGGGGGINNYAGNPLIVGNLFQGNVAIGGAPYPGFYGSGGGIYSGSLGAPTIQNNVFKVNTAMAGGGVFSSNGTVQNNTFVGNSAGHNGGGLTTLSGLVQNNTFYNNVATYGGGIFATNSTIRSNIISENIGGGISTWSPDSNNVDYNNVWNNTGQDYESVIPGLHDISLNPLFIDAQSGDFHLSPSSPCIDSGDPDNYPEADFDGDIRPIGFISDIGADESSYTLNSVLSRTKTDYSILTYDLDSSSFTRIYRDGTKIHFNPDGSHDYTLEPDGQKTLYTYSPDGTIATMGIIAPSEVTPRWVWVFTYTDGKLSSITDPANRTTFITINGQGNLADVIFPDNSSQHFAYNATHLLTEHTNPNEAITTYLYDDYGRITRSIESPQAVYNPTTGQTEFLQEVITLLPSDTAYPLINTSMIGNPTTPAPSVPLSSELEDSVEYGRGGRIGHTNAWGSWLDETDGLGRTTLHDYDQRNNLTRLTHPDGNCVEYTYNPIGQVIQEDRMGINQCLLPLVDRNSTQVQTWAFTFESEFNQVKTAKDPLGNITTYIYDYEVGIGNAGKLIRIEHPPVRNEFGLMVTPVISYTYNNWGLLETETDARGTVTKYIYTQGTPDEAYGMPNALFAPGVAPVPGLLTRIIADFGGENLTTIHQDFDGAGNPLKTIEPGGHLTITFIYDEMNRVLRETDAAGIVTIYAYDRQGNLLYKVIDYTPDGTTGRNIMTEYTYNTRNQVLTERTTDQGLTVQTSTVYDINQQVAVTQDGRGNETIYLYDDADQLINSVDPAGKVVTYTYALDGQLETFTNADGFITRYTYDGYGRLTVMTEDEGGLNLTTRYAYDLNDNLLMITDTVGTMTCYTYDSHNRQTEETQDCGGLDLVTTYAYDVNGNTRYLTDGRGIVTTYLYDDLDRPTQMRLDDGGLNLTTGYTYDAAGNLYRQTDERGVLTEYLYDDLNRMTSSCRDRLGFNLCTVYGYDRLNNQTTVTDPNGVTTRTDYNGFSLPTRVMEDAGNINATTSYFYDNALNLVRLVDANLNPTQYAYDARNLLASEQYADGTTIGYTYDDRGNLSIRTDQDNNTTTHSYDGVGRLAEKAFSTGGWQRYGYDDAGRMLRAEEQMNGHHSLLTFGYNAPGDVISTTQSLDSYTWPVAYGYDYVSGVYTVTYPSGAERVQTLDHIGRLNAVHQGNGNLVANYEYHDLNSFTTVAYPNGLVTRTDYDALYRTTRVISAVADYRYGYDNAGNRTYMQRWHEADHPTDVYQHDSLYQLTQVWYGANATEPGNITSYDKLQWYDLDNLGNRLEVQNNGTSTLYQPSNGQQLMNPMNRYDLVDGTPFAYDLRGNTLNDQTNTYTYDILNRQTGMSGPGGNAQYIYDALGRRIAKIVDGVTVYYIYDTHYRVIEERTGDNSITARYAYSMGIDEPLTMERGGITYYYHHDALGSVTEVTNASGLLVEHYEYDIYGKPSIFDNTGMPIAISAVGNAYLFTSQQYDIESWNYYFRARVYAPGMGRFLQTDPLGFVDGMGLYVYVRNNPVDHTDPIGLRTRRRWRDPNFWRGWNLSIFDERGKELLGRWLDGSGDALIVEDGNWGRYMKANSLLSSQLTRALESDAQGRSNAGRVDIRFHAEIQDGFVTGYQMLHGTNADVGDFLIQGLASVSSTPEGRRIIEYDLKYTWNDKIDPEKSIPSDAFLAEVLELFYDPEDYHAHISWNADSLIRKCGNTIEVKIGYPFD